MFAGETLIPEVRAHLATYSDFLQTVASFPHGAAPKGVSIEICKEMRDQFDKLNSADLSSHLTGLCRPGHPLLTTIVHGELWENNILFAQGELFQGKYCVKILRW